MGRKSYKISLGGVVASLCLLMMFLTAIFPLLFIPGAAGVMELWDILGKLWLPILIALIPVTILVFAASGWVTQWIAGRKKHD